MSDLAELFLVYLGSCGLIIMFAYGLMLGVDLLIWWGKRREQKDKRMQAKYGSPMNCSSWALQRMREDLRRRRSRMAR